MHTTTTAAVETLSINTIRTLTIDAVEKANMGHPGMPMGAAPMAYALWARHLKHNPGNARWADRDRFVLSAGHGSMLLYSLLYLSGYGLTLDDIKQFRQWGSLTPGHPEFGHTVGVEATTGPLGQGVAMAVGMAMAEAHMGAVYNREGYTVVDHHTYAICGDGDLMEGISSEAASLAGHLKLGKLVVLYDSNDISLDGELSMSFSERVQNRFESYGWQYLRVDEQHDVNAIAEAIALAKADTERPTLIEIKTTIGYGSPNKAGKGGHGGTHGSPLGKEEVALTKQALNWPAEPDFYVPAEVLAHFAELKNAGAEREQAWLELLAGYRQAYPELAAEFERALQGELPEGWNAKLPRYAADHAPISTRSASGQAINALAAANPLLLGGSADLASSNMTMINGAPAFDAANYAGRNIWFGVREFAMGAALNGMLLHGGVKAFGGTFLVFSDYLRGAIRLSALMKLPVVYVFTHDSIAVGEDGPTHQPIEQIPSLRLIPDLTLFRPADANETAAAWEYALQAKQGPFVLALTRQNLPVLPGTSELAFANIGRGGYVLDAGGSDTPDVQLIATGSEVALALDVQKQLAAENIHARVVSVPSRELFEQQDEAYRNSVVLPQVKAKVVIEMAYPSGWDEVLGGDGFVVGIRKFGASAKADKVIREYGFTPEAIVQQIKARYFA
ncbi:transketolase [Paenibacillus sp. UNCCL117]|uniref:transketolase n=1 Tax=unclassified Paenibacillus TaxID=185978 RepID=UPI00088D8BAF|nr:MULTISPECIES: transketolase [unclassified Paenibacillus]SDC64351.1 transketolase [Paenibacillus sp. cl123]SFW22505.1 transketolase [Paenibacillus sp. UNCCL117]